MPHSLSDPSILKKNFKLLLKLLLQENPQEEYFFVLVRHEKCLRIQGGSKICKNSLDANCPLQLHHFGAI